MREGIRIISEENNMAYKVQEKKATAYFKHLSTHLEEKTYLPLLKNDFDIWKRKHLKRFSVVTDNMNGKKSTHSHYPHYIHWLDKRGKLFDYLNRSISYIYMRDIGRSLDDEKTKDKVRRSVESMRQKLLSQESGKSTFSMTEIYRWAQKENVESSIIWVLDKLHEITTTIPVELDPTETKRKLIKIIGGVVIQELDEMEESLSPALRANRLDQAIRLGYAYGLTYPFIDDILDSQLLSTEEKEDYAAIIRTTLQTGVVPELFGWIKHYPFMRFVHSELKEAFEYIKTQHSRKGWESFLEQSLVFFHSQEIDREKDLAVETYTNSDLYVPIILKSASSRLIVRSLIKANEDQQINEQTFYYGIYNQLSDDFADMFSDMEEGAVTPYTYYLKHHNLRHDLINPFEMYWTVVSYLIHTVYKSDANTREVILSRAINGLKRFKKKWGEEKYEQLMELFSIDPQLNRVIQRIVSKATDVEFFDKFLRDHMIDDLKNQKKEKEAFIDSVRKIRATINSMLPVTQSKSNSFFDDLITEAANYSLESGGKRLRPVMTWVMAVEEYNMEPASIEPLLKSLEYMHTASLIYDDLPAQDNASLRRGRPTLHEVYNTANAELTGIFLTQQAVANQASLAGFDQTAILHLIYYSSTVATEMCKGQAIDLSSRGKTLTIDELTEMCFYKTGIGFEASLIMPAILAGKDDIYKEKLKLFAKHAGIAFQIKDDILDVEGESTQTGKNTRQDLENHSATFVSVLGLNGAKKLMWDHYCNAAEALQVIKQNSNFLKHLLDYVINREN
ncbi:polyprenyl synthetase family protein [Oceanobacillus manasiensis]|uniref:polyprenyl synthetase family protein n=1 Tax=Oceanobacillus manasiensis TaxID=586413 RepID=UPI0005A84BFA|nr:polyprenyl synthetase family protein [Oceanobacillus manasiensis]